MSLVVTEPQGESPTYMWRKSKHRAEENSLEQHNDTRHLLVIVCLDE